MHIYIYIYINIHIVYIYIYPLTHTYIGHQYLNLLIILAASNADDTRQIAVQEDQVVNLKTVRPFSFDRLAILRIQLVALCEIFAALRVLEWTAGRWMPVVYVSTLVFPVRFKTKIEVLTANDPPIRLPSGSVGQLLKFDIENDLIVFLDDHSGSHIIFLSDAVRLEFG